MKKIIQNTRQFLSKYGIFIACAITILFTIGILIFGFVAETNKLEVFNGQALSKFMYNCFEAHHKFSENIQTEIEQCYINGYLLYYVLLYLAIILYSVSAIVICSRTKKVSWCAYVIGISVIFLVFMNAYLTEMLQYEDSTNSSIYQTYMTSFISLATILSGIAGIKITFLFQKKTAW